MNHFQSCVVNTSVLRSGGTDSREWHFPSLSSPWLSRASARQRDAGERSKTHVIGYAKNCSEVNLAPEWGFLATVCVTVVAAISSTGCAWWSPRVFLPPLPSSPTGSRRAVPLLVVGVLGVGWLSLALCRSRARTNTLLLDEHHHARQRRRSRRRRRGGSGSSSNGSGSSVARSPASSTAGRVNNGAGRCAALSGASGGTAGSGGVCLQVLPTLELDAAHLPQAPSSWHRIRTCGGWDDRARSAGQLPAFGRGPGESRLLPVLKGKEGSKEGAARRKMQTGEETATAEEPILEEGSGREQVREGRSARLFAVSHLSFFFFLFLARNLCMDSTRRLRTFQKQHVVFLFVVWQNIRLTFSALSGVTFSPRSLMPGASARAPNSIFDMNEWRAGLWCDVWKEVTDKRLRLGVDATCWRQPVMCYYWVKLVFTMCGWHSWQFWCTLSLHTRARARREGGRDRESERKREKKMYDIMKFDLKKKQQHNYETICLGFVLFCFFGWGWLSMCNVVCPRSPWWTILKCLFLDLPFSDLKDWLDLQETNRTSIDHHHEQWFSSLFTSIIKIHSVGVFFSIWLWDDEMMHSS